MSFYELCVEWSRWGWPLLVNHLWQATLFFLFVLIVSAPLKRAPARVRYSLLLVALLKFVLPSTVIVWFINRVGIDVSSLFTSSGDPGSVLPISPFLSPVTHAPAVQQTIEPAHDIASPVITHIAAAPEQSYWYIALTLIWLVGSLLLLGLWLRRRCLLTAAIRAGKTVSSGREFEILERVRSWLGLRRNVTLIISPTIAEPGVWRALKPVVVLPAGITERLSDGELEAVMMHELIHVERWDNLVSIPQRIICCLLWFHPLIWLLDGYLLAEREQSCDDAVIKLSGNPQLYASSIKKVCRHSLGWELTGLSGVAGSNLKKRIKRIAAADINRSPSILHRALLGAVAAALIFLSAVTGIINRVELNAQSNNRNEDTIDSRFVTATSEQDKRENAAATLKESASKPLPPQQTQETTQQTKNPTTSPLEVRGRSEQIEQTESSTLAFVNQPQTKQDSPPLTWIPAPADAPRTAAIIPASVTRADLSQFVGRYEVEPARAENFILDITLEHGELWLKPSHAPKRKLLLTSETGLTDVYSDFRFTAIQDDRGRVIGLRLDSWSKDVTARKLSLPRPSMKGTMTFRLHGYSNARIVALAGTFNKWNQSQLLFAREGNDWVCRVNLAPGQHQYKFIIDGDWITDPGNPKIVQDERGNRNSLLTTD